MKKQKIRPSREQRSISGLNINTKKLEDRISSLESLIVKMATNVYGLEYFCDDEDLPEFLEDEAWLENNAQVELLEIIKRKK